MTKKEEINKTLEEVYSKERQIKDMGKELNSLMVKNVCQMLDEMSDGSLDIDEEEDGELILNPAGEYITNARSLTNTENGFSVAFDDLPDYPSSALGQYNLSAIHEFVHQRYIKYLQD